MLIIPIEKKPDWQHPPWICISLVILNFLIFAFYQSNDDALWEQATEAYTSHRLIHWEKEPFIEYMTEKHDLSNEEREDLAAAGNSFIREQAIFDRGFSQYLDTYWQQQDQKLSNNLVQRFFGEKTDKPVFTQASIAEWRLYRKDVEQIRDKISSIKYGITPAEPNVINFISNQFLHGSWDHLIGNMVFLCIFGITLELALGSMAFLSLYLLTGIAAAAMFVGANWGSYIPAIGASGAVSGLMGMYLALYRLKKIRFFYNFAFYFGEFKAPALLVLPLWLGKELYGHFFSDTNVAYWAHIGGLVSGVCLLLLSRHTVINVDEEKIIDKDREETEILKPRIAQIQAALGNLDVDKAKVLAKKLTADHPNMIQAWETGFDIMKRTPNQKDFHEFTFALLKNACQQTNIKEWQPFIEACLNEYQQLAVKPLALNAGLSTLLAKTLFRLGDVAKANHFAQLAVSKGGNSKPLHQVLIKLIDYYQRRQQLEKARDLALMRDKLSPS